MPTSSPTLAQLQKALGLAEQIQRLEEELAAVLGGTSGAAVEPKPTGKRGRPAKTQAKASVAAPAGKAGKKKRVLSPEGRARIVAALKARHAARKKAQAA